MRRRSPLLALEQVFSTQYVTQWLNKTGVGAELRQLGPLSAKQVRTFFEQNWQRLGQDPTEKRRWKRAAVLIINCLNHS